MRDITLEHNLSDDDLEEALEKALHGVRKAKTESTGKLEDPFMQSGGRDAM
jgi:hypothetical protein